jgi:hypothetical protein
MAVVTEYLIQLIAKQVEDRGLVVWYDPERACAQAAAELSLAKTTIARYEGSFFRLRHEIDDLLNDGQPPRFVVYVPMLQGDTQSALIELEAAGVVMRPGQQPPNRNTKLAVARLSRFWSEVEPAVQARWALIAAAAEVLLEADRVATEIKKPPTTVAALVKAYAEDDQPWCLLDTHHRHLESRKYNFEFDTSGEHEGLEKLIAKAEHRYTEVGSALAIQFVTTFQKATHPIKGLLQQRDSTCSCARSAWSLAIFSDGSSCCS